MDSVAGQGHASIRSSPDFNAKAARAKLMAPDQPRTASSSPGAPASRRRTSRTRTARWPASPATPPGRRPAAAATCRSRPTGRPTSHKYEGEETRNFATYNPQVARDDMFQLGRHSTIKGNDDRAGALDLGAGASRRPTSTATASMCSSRRSRPAAFPARPSRRISRTRCARTETKTCSDCHVSAANDNNAIMAQLLLLGTNFVNFVGMQRLGRAWSAASRRCASPNGTSRRRCSAPICRSTPIPTITRLHVEQNNRELMDWRARQDLFGKLAARPTRRGHPQCRSTRTGDAARCLQLRGEYMYVARGQGRLPRL